MTAKAVELELELDQPARVRVIPERPRHFSYDPKGGEPGGLCLIHFLREEPDCEVRIEVTWLAMVAVVTGYHEHPHTTVYINSSFTHGVAGGNGAVFVGNVENSFTS